MSFATRVRYWLPLLPLLGLLGATYWLNQQVQPEPAKPDNSMRHDPDSTMENFSATRLNEQGSPHFIMSAAKMLHFPDDGSTALEQPRITLLADNHPKVHATAKTGTVSKNGEELFLYGDVEVLREEGAQQDRLRLQTEYLQVNPAQDLVSSNLAVTIIEANTTVNAVGLELNNKTRTIKLLSKVRSEYVPTGN